MSIVRKLITRRGERDGALAIEFAIMAPLVIILVFAVVQFSFLLNAWQGLHAAAREGARIGSLSTTSLELVETRVEAALDGVRLAGEHETTVTPLEVCFDRRGLPIRVVVTADANVAIPFWGAFTVPLTGKGEFRCE